MAQNDHEPGGDPVYEVRFDPDRESAATAVVYAVSEAEGIEPDELDHHLNEAVGPDALDTIVSEGTAVVVDFVFEGYEVYVDCEGGIRLYEADD